MAKLCCHVFLSILKEIESYVVMRKLWYVMWTFWLQRHESLGVQRLQWLDEDARTIVVMQNQIQNLNEVSSLAFTCKK